MRHRSRSAVFALALVLAATSSTSAPVWAAPPGGVPPGQAQGHGHGHGPPGQGDEGRGDEGRPQFNDHDRVVIRGYYEGEWKHGRCPPGLAKKQNGCMPPGQAKRWAVGQPLPQGLVYYSLPPSLVVQLTPPPSGYRYVRVASDILMIAAGTGMVAAAIEDLGR